METGKIMQRAMYFNYSRVYICFDVNIRKIKLDLVTTITLHHTKLIITIIVIIIISNLSYDRFKASSKTIPTLIAI
jgi:hypothetical protein